MPLQNRLLKRGSTYYFRARVPADLKPYLGKEVKRSLKTKDRSVANRKVREASVEFDRHCEALRDQIRLRQQLPASGPITDEIIQQLCDVWRYTALSGDEDNRIAGELNDPEHLAERQATDAALEGTLGKTDLEAIEPALHQFLWLTGVPPIDPSRDGYRKLLYRFLQTARSVHSEQLQRDAGKVILTPAPPARTLLQKDSGASVGQGEGVTLSDAFEDWKRFDPNRPEKTVEDMQRLVTEFDIHTHGKTIEQIERAEVIAYRDALRARPLAAKTVIKRIGQLCTLINTVIDSGKFKGPNPAQRIPKPKDDSVSHEPFDHDELQRIFSAPVFRGRHNLKKGSRLARMGETGYWIPILALYQGCRREELGQLLVADVRKIDGIDCLDVTDLDKNGDLKTRRAKTSTNSEKTLKNKSSRRKLPLHPKVIELGFLDYVERIRSQGHTRLFPYLKQRKDGKFTDYFGKVFSEFLRQNCGITSRSRVFHSFRNNFRDACREAGLDEEISDALMGHSDRDKTGRSYGRGFRVPRLHKAMMLIEYPELVIPKYDD